MARITVEDCNEQVENRFALVLMASTRAKQLLRGARPMVRADQNRAVVVSLREIAAGNVKPDADDLEDLAGSADPGSADPGSADQ